MIALFRYFIFIVLLFLSLGIITPLALLRPMNNKNSFVFFKVFAFLCRYLCGVRLNIEGRDIVEKNRPSVVVGNHQHNFDVLTARAIFTQHTVVLGKYELGYIPIFGQIYTLCGNILVQRGKHKKAMESMASLEKKIIQKGLSVLIFPEGHRNSKKEMLPFKKGAFYTAINTQIPIIPFSVSQFVQYDVLNKLGLVDIYIRIHEPINTKGKTHRDIIDIMKKTRSVIEDGVKELNQKYD